MGLEYRRRSCLDSNGWDNATPMKVQQDLETQFTETFQPIFLWGVGALELILILYTLYQEFVTGTGPSLLATVLPLSVVIAIVWAVLSVLITLAVIGVNNHRKRDTR